MQAETKHARSQYENGASRKLRDAPFWRRSNRPSDRMRPDQPKIRPFAFDVAAAYRFWTSSQLTTFQKAFT